MSTRNLYLLCGPSGSGKTTIGNLLIESGYTRVKSCTTRPPRIGESSEVYHFISKEEFLGCKEMLTAAEYAGYYYGVYPFELLEKDFYIIEPVGIRLLRKQFKQKPLKVIGLIASMQSLRERLAERGDIGLKRLEEDKVTFADFGQECDILILNEDLDAAFQTVISYIKETEGSC